MILIALIAAAWLQSAGWTWTLYEDDATIVLANEIPDSANLKSTLECAPGTGVARITLYDPALAGTGDFATLSSGSQTGGAATPVSHGPGKAVISLRTDHPVFSAFVSAGRLDIAMGNGRTAVAVDPGSLTKLRRFADLCAG